MAQKLRCAFQLIVSALNARLERKRLSEQDRSALYLALLPAVNSARVDLLDHSRLLAQLSALERRTGPSGRDTVDHPRHFGSHDDIANACAGAIVLALGGRRRMSRELMSQILSAGDDIVPDWPTLMTDADRTTDEDRPEEQLPRRQQHGQHRPRFFEW